MYMNDWAAWPAGVLGEDDSAGAHARVDRSLRIEQRIQSLMLAVPRKETVRGAGEGKQVRPDLFCPLAWFAITSQMVARVLALPLHRIQILDRTPSTRS